MLVWPYGAPTLDQQDPQSGVNVAAFVDQIISSKKEWDGTVHTNLAEDSTDDTWQDLLNHQTHHHTRTCKRKRGNQWVCRFNIPFYPMMETQVLLPYEPQGDTEDTRVAEQRRYEEIHARIRSYLDENTDALSTSDMSFEEFLRAVDVSSNEEYLVALRSSLKRPKIFIQRLPNAVLVNNYSPKIFNLMKSNMDIQFVLDPYACCSYIVDYINKADRGMSEALDQVYQQCREDANTSVFEMLKSLAATYYNASEISAQEAAYNILGLRMVESSVRTVFVPTSKPGERVHMLRPRHQLLRLQPDDSTDIFVPGLLSHYVNRSEVLLHITLAQFTAYYAYSKTHPCLSRNNGNANRSEYENEGASLADDDDGELVKKKKNPPSNDYNGVTGSAFDVDATVILLL